MVAHKTEIWRGFTWKRFIKFSLVFFLFLNAFNIIGAYFDPESTIDENFRFKTITNRLIGSLIYGFLMAFWFEPRVDNKKI